MVALLVHRCCRERVAAVIEEYCRAPQHDAHAHWYTTSTSTCSAFDLAASTLGFIGLLYINASIWQILRGSQIIFSALFSILFLDRVMH